MQSFDTAWAKSCQWELAETGQKQSLIGDQAALVRGQLLGPKGRFTSSIVVRWY